MAKKQSTDQARVAALLAAARDGASPSAADAAAVARLGGQGSIDGLDGAAGLAAVAAALELGAAERIADASTARDKDVRKAARAAAHRLRSAGVEVPQASTGTVWSIGKEERLLPAPRALLGLPEEDGYVPFLLASYGSESACLSGGAAGPVQGFRDDDHGHLSRSQARKILDDARGEHRLYELAFHDAVALLERAFDAAGGKRPGGWGHLLSHIDEGTLNSARLLDPLRALPQELDVDALHRPDPLLDGRWMIGFAAPAEAVQGSISEVLGALTSELYPDDEARRQRIDELIDEAATTALAGPERATWAYGLNVVALLAHRAEEPEAASVARATALALEQGRPGQDVPWAREWVSRQLSWVVDLAMRSGTGPA